MEDYILGSEKVVNTNEVYPNDWNPKDSIDENKENKEMYEEIKEELRKKGQFEAITVRERDNGEGGKYQILDGFHRWMGTNELGRPKIKINNLGKIDDLLAKAITVIKEKKKVPVSELKLAELVEQMSSEGVGNEIIADLLGMKEEKIEEYVKLNNFDWEDYKTEISNDEKNEVMVSEDTDLRIATIKIKLTKDGFLKIKDKIENEGKDEFIESILSL